MTLEQTLILGFGDSEQYLSKSYDLSLHTHIDLSSILKMHIIVVVFLLEQAVQHGVYTVGNSTESLGV